jgi:hypothetical protein
MTYSSRSFLLAAAIAGACAPAIAFAQSSTSPGTTTPAIDCNDVAADPNCKSNQNQKEQQNDANNPDQQDDLNNPASQTQVDPAAENNEQTPGSIDSPENASGGNAVSPSGSGNIQGNDAGGVGSNGTSGTNN